jgi:hypothetical protein
MGIIPIFTFIFTHGIGMTPLQYQLAEKVTFDKASMLW